MSVMIKIYQCVIAETFTGLLSKNKPLYIRVAFRGAKLIKIWKSSTILTVNFLRPFKK